MNPQVEVVHRPPSALKRLADKPKGLLLHDLLAVNAAVYV